MQKFKVAHLNIRSLVAKLNDLKQIVKNGDYDVVAVTETWLSNGIGSEELRILGYSLVRQDRISRGGGVCIYYKNNLNASRIGVRANASYEHEFMQHFEEQIMILAPIYNYTVCYRSLN